MTDTTNPTPNDVSGGIHRKWACAGCRRRKSKCDTRQPRCTTCIAYENECRYDKPPSLAYVSSLEEEIVELQRQLRQARTQEKKALASPSSSDEFSRLTHEPPLAADGTSAMSLGQVIAIGSGSVDEMKRSLVMNAQTQGQWEDLAVGNASVKLKIPNELSNELLKYHWCWIHPLFMFVYRPAFIRGMSMVNASSPDAPDRPYFSESLLKVIVSHCAQFLNRSVNKQMYTTRPGAEEPVSATLSSAEFMTKATEEARICLGMDTLKPSAIPTIQALLQQSALEIAVGRSSQGWLYSGMAFRMAFDIGIHLPSDKLQAFVKSLSTEDIEIRKRLFWSCYTWDKTISIFLGRTPTFLPDTDGVPLNFNDASDTEPWSPYYGDKPSESDVKPQPYPSTPGYVVSCFRQLCKLSIILNDLIQGIYSPTAAAHHGSNESDPPKPALDTPFMRIARDLREWWLALPEHLRISPDRMPPLAPPTHIVSLNVLYQTTIILLHRPFILGTPDLSQPAAQKSYEACVVATAAVHDLLRLQANTFGFTHLTHMNAYAAYIAATIAVLQFERGRQLGEDTEMTTQNTGLNFLVEVLQRCADRMPALNQSVAMIRKRMKTALGRLTTNTLQKLFPCPSQQQELPQPNAFQLIPNPYALNDHNHQQQQQQQHESLTYAPQGIPFQWQSNVRSSLFKEEPSFGDEDLPAFPGQTFSIGSEHIKQDPGQDM